MSNRFMHHYLALGLLGAVAALSGQVRAETRCAAPQTRLDAAACEAARQGPTELRRFIQRVQGIESLYFFDYVDEARAIAWREQDDSTALRKRMIVHATLAANAAK